MLSCVVYVVYEPEKEKCIWLNSIYNQHLSETKLYEKRLRLRFISLCNLLLTLFETYILLWSFIYVCHYIWSFYRWCSIPTWILLLCFKGKDFFSFMNVVFSIILKLLTHNVSDIMCSSFCNSLKWNRYMSTVHFPPLTQRHHPRDFRIPHLILINFHIN